MGGIDALILSADMGVVLNAPIIICSALFWVHSRVDLMNDDFPSQNATLLYVVIGRIVPR